MISAVVLNYQKPELTARSISAFRDAARGAGFAAESIVVDNSGPSAGRPLREILPEGTQIIENSSNRGFARASNQGMAQARGRYLLLLNNDCFVNAEVLKGGVEYLESHPAAGIWAPRLVDAEGRVQVSCAREPTLASLAAEYLLGRFRDWYPGADRWTTPREVETVVGAFMLLRRDSVERAGVLDEDYFFNVEDIDYCRRVRKAGLAVVYDPRASVVHLGGASQEHRTRAADAYLADPYLHRHRVLYFRKQHGVLAGMAAGSIIWTGRILRKLKRRLAGESRSPSIR